MGHDEALEYCRDLAKQLVGKLDTIPEGLQEALFNYDPNYVAWTTEVWELASELYMVLPERESDHMQQAYTAKLAEHQAFIDNERGEG